jgi:hypothetical protein
MSAQDGPGGPHGFLPRPICQPHAERNAGAIGDVLEQHLPKEGTLLEIASGTGQHAVTFGARFPGLTWLTSDPWARSRESTNGWIIETGLGNVKSPIDLDVTKQGWEDAIARPIAAMYASNLLHITPWPVSLGLFRGAGQLLEPGAPLCIYGCFKRNGAHLTEANAQFDRNIRGDDPEFGVRDMETLEEAAGEQGLDLEHAIDMPKENFVLVFRCS